MRYAMWPTDGSGRPTPAERALYLVTATLCAVVLIWIGHLVAGHLMAGHDATAGTSGNGQTDMRRGTTERERQLIIEGAYLSWSVADGCVRGTRECRDALREANANPYGIKILRDGTAIEREDWKAITAVR